MHTCESTSLEFLTSKVTAIQLNPLAISDVWSCLRECSLMSDPMCVLNDKHVYNSQMGKHTCERKKEQRRRQKLRKKKRMKAVLECDSVVSSDLRSSNMEILQPGQTEDEDEVGADMDATRIALADELMTEGEEYTIAYLQNVKDDLLRKVEYNRERIEQLKSANLKQLHKHRQEVDRIRTFYQTIAYAKTRTGRMVQTALRKSSAAAQVLEEVGITYRQNKALHNC